MALRGGRVAGHVLTVGTCLGIILAIAQANAFLITHALLGTWVLAEVADRALQLVLYRQGALEVHQVRCAQSARAAG